VLLGREREGFGGERPECHGGASAPREPEHAAGFAAEGDEAVARQSGQVGRGERVRDRSAEQFVLGGDAGVEEGDGAGVRRGIDDLEQARAGARIDEKRIASRAGGLWPARDQAGGETEPAKEAEVVLAGGVGDIDGAAGDGAGGGVVVRVV